MKIFRLGWGQRGLTTQCRVDLIYTSYQKECKQTDFDKTVDAKQGRDAITEVLDKFESFYNQILFRRYNKSTAAMFNNKSLFLPSKFFNYDVNIFINT